MNKQKLIEIAVDEGRADGAIVMGYCDVDGEISTLCTRDLEYADLCGHVTDCVHASATAKSNCQYWHRVRRFALSGENG